MIDKESVWQILDLNDRVSLAQFAHSPAVLKLINSQITFNRLSLTQINFSDAQELQQKYQELQNAVKFWTEFHDFLIEVAAHFNQPTES